MGQIVRRNNMVPIMERLGEYEKKHDFCGSRGFNMCVKNN